MTITGYEFFEITDPFEIVEILQPIINEFVRQGYRNVPDCETLADEMREQIRKNGWGQKPVEEVAERVAMRGCGMGK